MILFIQNIPPTTRPHELRNYVAPAVGEEAESGVEEGRVLKAEVMVIRDRSSNLLEHHGLVVVNSEASGWRAIERLTGLPFNGVPVLVRKYNSRDQQNDRRRSGLPTFQAILEKRNRDRRRGYKVEIYVDFSNVFNAAEN